MLFHLASAVVFNFFVCLFVCLLLFPNVLVNIVMPLKWLGQAHLKIHKKRITYDVECNLV